MIKKYSQKLKDAVIDYSTAEKEYGVIPVEMALSNQDFPDEYKHYPQDWILPNHFLVGFEDIIKIIKEEDD